MLALQIATIVLSLCVTGLGLTSQAWKNYRLRSVAGLSSFYFSLLAVSYTLWTSYGVIERDYVLIIPMALGTIMSWVVVIQCVLYRQR